MGKEKQKLLKKIKFEYVLIIILAVLAVAIFFSSTSFELPINKTQATESNNDCDSLESKLENLISNIDGVGKSVVSISLDGTTEEIILKNTESVTQNGSTVTTETAVLVNGKPYVLKELSPKILGVVIVCEGGDDLSVKLKITEAITTILEVSSDNIRILKMK